MKAVEELRRHSINADVTRDPLGKHDIYIDIDDLDKLNSLCMEGKLTPETRSSYADRAGKVSEGNGLPGGHISLG